MSSRCNAGSTIFATRHLAHDCQKDTHLYHCGSRWLEPYDDVEMAQRFGHFDIDTLRDT